MERERGPEGERRRIGRGFEENKCNSNLLLSCSVPGFIFYAWREKKKKIMFTRASFGKTLAMTKQ